MRPGRRSFAVAMRANRCSCSARAACERRSCQATAATLRCTWLPGEAPGLMDLIDEAPRSVSALAQDDVEVLVLPTRAVRRAFVEHPHALLQPSASRASAPSQMLASDVRRPRRRRAVRLLGRIRDDAIRAVVAHCGPGAARPPSRTPALCSYGNRREGAGSLVSRLTSRVACVAATERPSRRRRDGARLLLSGKRAWRGGRSAS